MPRKTYGLSPRRSYLTTGSGDHIDEHSGCNLHSALLEVVAQCCNSHIVAVLACCEMAVQQLLHSFQKLMVHLLRWGLLSFSGGETQIWKIVRRMICQISLKLSHNFSEKLYLISNHNDIVGIAGNKSRISRSSNEIKQCWSCQDGKIGQQIVPLK